MKTETNLENKAIFFALHWMQSIIQDVENSGKIQIYPVHPSNMYRFEESILLLKSVENISDEDVIELFQIKRPHWSCVAGDEELRSWGHSEQYISYIKIMAGKGLIELYIENAFVVDFLRSKGYAVPWLGLSVQEMVDAGWIKLYE